MGFENTNENIVEANVQFCRYMYPKSGHKDGDYAIVSMYVENVNKGEIKTNEQWGTIVIKGNMPKMKKDTTYKLKAEGIYNSNYKSYEYSIKYITTSSKIETPEERNKFLTKILSEKHANLLLESFEDPLQVILDEDMEKLCSIKGIKEKTATSIIKTIVNNLDYSTAFIELEKYEMTNPMIKKLVDNYGSPEVVVAKIKENPYLLVTEVVGMGFKKTDMLALAGGMSANSVHRFESFIIHYLTEKAIGGKSYVPQREVMGAIIEALKIDPKNTEAMTNLRTAIYSLNSKNKLWWDEKKNYLALTKYRDIEYDIAKEIERLKSSSYKFVYNNWEKEIEKIEEKQGWKYTDEQKAGVKTTLDNNVVVITGLAGTGKTTVTKAMTKILENYSISQCALSGRASQRIAENTGMEAHTIHRLLGSSKDGFLHNASMPLGSDIIIFDEASMPSMELVLALLRAIKTGSKLIIIGDYGQLSSIGAGNFFMDLLESGAVPVVKLTEVHRQAQASAIISKSIDIRNQKQLFDYGFEGDMTLGELQDLTLCVREMKEALPDLIMSKFEEEYVETGKDINKVQIIVPTRMRGALCCKELNYKIQEKYNPHDKEEGLHIYGKYEYYLFQDDKVIVTKNNKKVFNTDGEAVKIFNGNLGTIVDLDIKNKSIIVDIDSVGEVVIEGYETLATIELAYAITCHKLQGSSAERVIIGMDYSSFMLLSCEWLYTAITRAEIKATLGGESKAIRTAISKRETNDKLTFLPFALKKQAF